jgi:hypothetical protein
MLRVTECGKDLESCRGVARGPGWGGGERSGVAAPDSRVQETEKFVEK